MQQRSTCFNVHAIAYLMLGAVRLSSDLNRHVELTEAA